MNLPPTADTITPLDEHITHALRGTALLKDEVTQLRERVHQLEVAKLLDDQHITHLETSLREAQLDRNRYLTFATTMLTHIEAIGGFAAAAKAAAHSDMADVRDAADARARTTAAERLSKLEGELTQPSSRTTQIPPPPPPTGLTGEIPKFLQEGPRIEGDPTP